MPNAMEIVTPSLSAGVTLLFHRMHAGGLQMRRSLLAA